MTRPASGGYDSRTANFGFKVLKMRTMTRVLRLSRVMTLTPLLMRKMKKQLDYSRRSIFKRLDLDLKFDACSF